MDRRIAAEKCACELIPSHRTVIVSAWEDFEDSDNTAPLSTKNGISNKNKPSVSRLSRYGYETTEDKYMFQHYEDTRRYMLEYTENYSIASRLKKKKTPKPSPPSQVPLHRSKTSLSEHSK